MVVIVCCIWLLLSVGDLVMNFYGKRNEIGRKGEDGKRREMPSTSEGKLKFLRDLSN
jgi:hypothetical protein